MHSRIFQVSLNPIKKCNYITENNYWEHWFLDSIADYVVDSNDREYDIEWLKKCVAGCVFGSDDNGDYIIATSRTEYFAEKFEEFRRLLNAAQNYNIEDFATGIAEMYGIQSAYEDKFGFYVDADGELMTFDCFVRLCEVGEKYYIGGTLDYHC